MRRRLTIALVGIALASVLLVGAGILILAQVGAEAQATADAIDRIDVLAEVVAIELTNQAGDNRRLRPGAQPILRRVFPVLGFDDARFVVVEPDGAASTIEGFSARGGGRQRQPLAPLAQLDDDQLATLASGEAVVVDRTQLTGDGGADRIGRDGRAVLVVQAVDSQFGADLVDGNTLAVAGRQPVVTVGREARVWFVVSAVAVLVGALVAGIVLARRYATPITEIERATAEVAAGDFSVRVDVSGDDELAQLGRSVNEMAAELERSKALDQQFLMSVSHDLRTPLTAIAGYGEALRDGAIDDPGAAGEVIGNQAARLERLVGDLLDLARLDANRFRLRLDVVDVAVVVGRTVAGLVPRAERHGIACTFDNGGPAFASVDPDRLGQAVGNLIDNALKYASSAVATRVSVDDASAVIEVTDDGPGIPAEDLPHVFERLYVSRHQPARAENPSGMGLAIVRELSTAMGGTVLASPAEGSGTTMTIRLPLQADPRSDE